MSPCDISWCLTALVFQVFVGALRDKQVNEGRVSTCCRSVQGKTCVHILTFKATIKEQLKDVCSSRVEGPAKSARFADTRVGAVIQQQADRFDSTPPSCNMKWRWLKPVIVGSASINIRPPFE